VTVVGITDYVAPPFEVEREALGPDTEFVHLDSENEATFDPDQLARLDALLVWHAPITRKTVDHLDRCRLVVRYGVGYDNIDTKTLSDRQIHFCNTPDYGTEEVADTAAAMILNLHRGVSAYDAQAKDLSDTWQEHVIPALTRSNETSVGIIGVGRIGTAVMNRLRPFGFQLFGFDPYQPAGHEKAISYNRVDSLDDLLRHSDIVSIHCPMTDETAGMIDEAAIRSMRDGAILVNTARGGIVRDFDTLWHAIDSGKLGGAGLDVLPQEPPGDHPMIEAWRRGDLKGRLIINPHTAYYSTRAWYEMRFKAAETVRQFFSNGTLRNHIGN
jgi:lactate dehydrogenase-like 2-hydroxyacid dehydrogenase